MRCVAALVSVLLSRHNEGVGPEWLVTLMATGTLLLSVAGAAARASRRASQWQSRVEEMWRDMAEKRGATLTVDGRSPLSPRRLSMLVPIGDANVVLRTTVPVERGSLSHTRVHADYVLGAGPSFRMWDRLGIDPAGVEGDVFDAHGPLARRVRLTTSGRAATRAFFSETAQRRAARFARPLMLRSDGRRVELVWDGVELDPRVLEDAVTLVGEVALGGVDVLRELAEIDGAEWVPGDEDAPSVGVRRGAGEVRLFASTSPNGPVYHASATPRRALPAFSVHIDDEGVLHGVMPRGIVDPDESGQLPHLGRSRLEGEGELLELTWEKPPSRSEAEAAVRLLGALAARSGHGGAFR